MSAIGTLVESCSRIEFEIAEARTGFIAGQLVSVLDIQQDAIIRSVDDLTYIKDRAFGRVAEFQMQLEKVSISDEFFTARRCEDGKVRSARIEFRIAFSIEHARSVRELDSGRSAKCSTVQFRVEGWEKGVWKGDFIIAR